MGEGRLVVRWVGIMSGGGEVGGEVGRNDEWGRGGWW